jgi:hypothetical protein
MRYMHRVVSDLSLGQVIDNILNEDAENYYRNGKLVQITTERTGIFIEAGHTEMDIHSLRMELEDGKITRLVDVGDEVVSELERLITEWYYEVQGTRSACIGHAIRDQAEYLYSKGVTLDNLKGEIIMKNAMFQYATKYRTLNDTPLITLEEAISLFKENREDFKSRLKSGEEPEMAVWIDCKSSDSYGETLYHWDSDMKVIDGILYQAV